MSSANARDDFLAHLDQVAEEELAKRAKIEKKVEEYKSPSFFSKRGLAQRGVAAAKGAVSGITELPYLPYNIYRAVRGEEPVSTGVPEYLEAIEKKMVGDKLRPRTRGEKRVENFWRGVGDYATFATGVGGLARGLGKGAAKILPKVSKRLLTGGKELARSSRSVPALGTAGLTSEIVPEVTRELDPALALPTALGTAMATGKLSRSAMHAAKLPSKILGADPEKIRQFKEAGLPATLGDVSPKLASLQAWAHRAAPSKKMGKIYAKRAKYLEENFPTSETLESAAAKLEKGALARKEFRSRQQARYTGLRDKLMEKEGVRSFTPDETKRVIGEYYQSLRKQGIASPEARTASSRLGKIMQELTGDEGIDAHLKSLKKAGINLEDYPTQVQEQVISQLKDSGRKIPLGEAHLADLGIMDRLNALSGWEKRIGLSKSEGLARRLQKTLSKDIEAAYEKVAPGIEKPRKAAWKEYKELEEKGLELALKPGQLPEDTLRKVTTNFMRGGTALPTMLKHLPKSDQKSVFNTFVMNMSRFGKVPSLNQLSKVYGNLDENQQKFLLEGISKYNNIPKGKFENLLKSLENTKFTQSMANVSGTASHNVISQTVNDLMNAGKEAASGNSTHFIGSLKNFMAKIASPMFAGPLQSVMGSQKFLNSLEYMSRIKSPSQVPIGLHKLKEAGISPKLVRGYQQAWRTGFSMPESRTAKRAQELGMAYRDLKKRRED